MKNNLIKPFSSRRVFLMTAGAIAAVGAGLLAFGWGGSLANARVIKVVKSPDCSCCGEWVAYLEHAGWRVDVENREDVTPTKREAGVPIDLESCHTAFVDGYVIEGHVPLPAIEKLLAKRPDLTGISVPGMPTDAPGMGGGGELEVFGFKDGTPTGFYTRTRV